jgi:hypothetical protein
LLLVTKHSKNSQRGLKNKISSFLARLDSPVGIFKIFHYGAGWLQCSIVTKIALSIAYCGSSFEAVMRTKLAPIKHFKINEKKLFQ